MPVKIHYHLLFSTLLHVVGLASFCYGFFPYSNVDLGYAEYGSNTIRPEPPFDRLVFMVIDALRSDFAFSVESGMNYTKALIGMGHAAAYTAEAAAPTVTLPRLKALTTGAIPGFLDAILNIAEADSSNSLILQDSWVKQLSLANKSIHMFGDNTWLKLFPESFSVSEGTSSFYDYTEVDSNVTRHLSNELKDNTWDALILHYLGMDHIGHSDGPHRKQVEMDRVIRQIYDTTRETDVLLNRSTLVIVTGDHGMTETGNHGGSSAAETSTAMILLSPKFSQVLNVSKEQLRRGTFDYYEAIKQSDIVPIISLFLGLPIPRNSLGILPQSLLPIWVDESERWKVISKNSRHLANIFEQQTGGSGMRKTAVHNDISGHNNTRIHLEETILYQEMRHLQSQLLRVSTKYKLRYMFGGIVLLVASLFSILFRVYQRPWHYDKRQYMNVVVILLYCLTPFASSYIEEEHQFWYWIMNLVLMYQSYFLNTYPSLVFTTHLRLVQALFLLRILRRANQTGTVLEKVSSKIDLKGQKYSGAPDILRSFVASRPILNIVLFVGTASFVATKLYESLPKPKAKFFSTLSVIIPVVIFRLATSVGEVLDPDDQLLSVTRHWLEASSVLLARICFCCIILLWIVIWSCEKGRTKRWNAYLGLWSIVILMQSPIRNACLIVLYYALHDLIKMSIPSKDAASVAYLVLQQVSFFAMGGSNALSSVDLSTAYHGLSSYNATIVGFLAFVSNWVGPIWWYVASCEREAIRGSMDQERNSLISTLCTAHSLSLCLACYILRDHLFVWTVFSPKVLYTATWLLFNSTTMLLRSLV